MASTNNAKKTNVGPIVGGVVGGVGGFLIFLGLGIFFWRRHKQTEHFDGEKGILGFGASDQTTTPIPYNYARRELPPLPPQETTPLATTSPSVSQADLYTNMASSKAREAAIAAAQVMGHRPAQPSSSFTALSDPPSSREPPSAPASSSGGGSAAQLSPSEVQGLRNEVENLRRVMEQFQDGRLVEPPPEYVEGSQVPR